MTADVFRAAVHKAHVVTASVLYVNRVSVNSTVRTVTDMYDNSDKAPIDVVAALCAAYLTVVRTMTAHHPTLER